MLPSENDATRIGIDSIGLSPGQCPPPVTCGFDDNTCGYSVDAFNEARWLLGIGRVSRPEMIDKFKPPIKEDGGMYMYVDTTSEITENAIKKGDEIKTVMTSDIATYDEGKFLVALVSCYVKKWQSRSNQLFLL